MIKIFQYGEEFQVKSVFQGKRKLLKNPEWWKVYSQYSEKFQGTLCFSGQVLVVQKYQKKVCHYLDQGRTLNDILIEDRTLNGLLWSYQIMLAWANVLKAFESSLQW